MKVQCIVQFLRILIGFKGKSIISIQQWIEMNMAMMYELFLFTSSRNNLEYEIMVM